MIISVIGSSNPATREHVDLAEGVGRELARRDIMVVCGGLSGIMEAVCRGAKAEGGTTIGILPGRAAAEANSYVDIPIVTSMGYSRNVIVVHTGEPWLSVGGAFGNLHERCPSLCERSPVLGLKTWPLTMNGDGVDMEGAIIQADDPADAVDKALAAVAALNHNR